MNPNDGVKGVSETIRTAREIERQGADVYATIALTMGIVAVILAVVFMVTKYDGLFVAPVLAIFFGILGFFRGQADEGKKVSVGAVVAGIITLVIMMLSF